MVRSFQIRIPLLVVVGSLAALCPAPISDPQPPSKPLLPVLSDEQRAQQQSQQRTFPEVGEVPLDTEPKPAEAPPSDPQAAAIVAGSRPTQGGRESGQPPVQASGGLPWIVLGLAGLLGVGAKVWVDRRIPVPADARRGRVP
ncbi:MAG: hypothetical protein WHU10_04810 [Fimbriimonadales bacterium]